MGCCKKSAVVETAVKAGQKCGKSAHHRPCHFKKCRKLIGLVVIGITVAAVLEELKKPAEERNWHGFVGGLVPYDFRVPTPEKLVTNLWNPEGPVVSPKTFGVGWDPNIGRIFAEAVALPDLVTEHHHDDESDVYEERF